MLDEFLEYNKNFVSNKEYKAFVAPKLPKRHVAILSCMDTRLTELLPQALGIKNGDVKIIKNAGAVISHPWGSVMRSIILAVYELGVREIMVIAHRDCGLSDLAADKILQKAYERGVPEHSVELLTNAGIDLNQWLTGFDCVEENVRQTVQKIVKHPLLPTGEHSVKVHGLVIDPMTGELELIVRGG